jgi:hypothetical protein
MRKEQFSLEILGKRIQKLILEKGYSSIYDFWVNAPFDGELSRATLNSIVKGKTDIKITTLSKIAYALEIELCDLF